MLAGGLRREGLADSRRTKEVYDETLALATDKVVEHGVGVMSLYKRAKESLAVFWKNESFEGLGVPLNGRDVLHIELHCWEVNMIPDEEIEEDGHTPELICKTKSIHNWRRQEKLIVGETKFIVVLCMLPYGACGMMVT